MKNRIVNLLLAAAFLAALSVLLNPPVRESWHSRPAAQAVAAYDQEVRQLDQGRYDALLDAAREYNRTLLDRSSGYYLTDDQKARYDSLLNVDGGGIMGYIEIPTIKLSLPIYHGTEEDVLQIAVGHLDWSSLPVGGESTHCVLSGHRGLPSAKLFTNLDQLVEGDAFVIRTLDEVLTYEVDQILIVEPDDVSTLSIEEGKDLCTLVTCTPYGVNSHRLLVRGHRVANQSEAIRVTSDAIQIEPLLVAPVLAIPMLLALLLLLLIPGRKKRPTGGNEHEKTE